MKFVKIEVTAICFLLLTMAMINEKNLGAIEGKRLFSSWFYPSFTDQSNKDLNVSCDVS